LRRVTLFVSLVGLGRALGIVEVDPAIPIKITAVSDLENKFIASLQ